MATENKRVNIYMNANILEKLDAHAEKLGLSRSSAISVIVYEYFRTEEATSAMGKLNDMKFFEMLAAQNQNA